ncbi:MAG: ATP-binding cassette domain-containing protein [Clostridia bacterium]|nr:ATP-binding cassette domain-containing protein [Clostridia bacterium]
MSEIIIKGLSKSYGDNKVIDGLTCTFGRGFYLLEGKSGSGKTTLLRLIAGLEAPDSGLISPTGGAMLFQEKRLIENRSGLRNITSFFGGSSAREALLLASRLGLEAEDMKKPVRSLSGGMAQRISIIRLVMHVRRSGDDTVLLDEPFTGLDAETAKKVSDIFAEEFAGKTVIVASHTDGDILPPLSGKIVLTGPSA